MPNHITNILKSSNKVLSKLVSGDTVDFNNIIKCNVPNKMNGYYFMSEVLAKEELGLSNKFFLKTENSKEIVDQKNLMVSNYQKTGYFHEIDFARKEWGTKWNAYNCDIEEDKIIFDTAWNAPIPVILKLSDIFPDEKITLTYADEDMGFNSKEIEFLGGKIISERDLSLKECCEIKDYDYEEYLKEMEED